MMSSTDTPSPGAFNASRVPESVAPPEDSATDLGILETLAELPVAEHLAIYQELHTQLSADLGSTSQEQW